MHKVLVIGDAMLDIYVEVDCDRISPEAPVPILRKKIKNKKELPGGAANVAMNLRALEIDVTLCCHLGNDNSGLKIKQILDNNSIKLLRMPFDESVEHCPTTTKTRFH